MAVAEKMPGSLYKGLGEHFTLLTTSSDRVQAIYKDGVDGLDLILTDETVPFPDVDSLEGLVGVVIDRPDLPSYVFPKLELDLEELSRVEKWAEGKGLEVKAGPPMSLVKKNY